MSAGVETRHQRAFHHDESGAVESEYDRLRELAHKEADERNRCFQRSRDAYSNGDGAAAKDLSNQGKHHASKVVQYNREASEYIFRENNAQGLTDDDEIDLHGQYIEEAERIVEERINDDRAAGRSRLCVITGKGIHSNMHLPKIKPAIEAIFDRMGLQYHSDEHNTGRIIVHLEGSSGEHTQSSQPHHGSDGQNHGKHKLGLLDALGSFIQKQSCDIM